MPLGLRAWEGGDKATTREPGDLPSVVVTREHIGRGVLVGVELSLLEAAAKLRSR